MKIWMIGARGTIATTLVVGTLAARRGLLALEALLTETGPFRAVPFIRAILQQRVDKRPPPF